jgi:hypothetical protein
VEDKKMAQQGFHWPNNGRIAFVLGIAFECWDRNKPSRGDIAAWARKYYESQ